MMSYVEIARRAIAKSREREESETSEERSSTGGLNSPSSLNSQHAVSDLNIDDPETWPAYLIGL